MFATWSRALDKDGVRISLLLIGIVATIGFGPLSAFGAYMLVLTPFSDASDRYHFLGWSIVGMGGLLGIVGGWIRLLVPSRAFRASAVLKWGTATALVAGVVVTALTAAGVFVRPANLLAWLMFPAVAIGVFLLGATIGEVRPNSTIERDGPPAARPSS